MKFGKQLAIIVHYKVLINLECYKSSVLDTDSNIWNIVYRLLSYYYYIQNNTILKINKISRRLKSEITKISNIQSL